jgi:DNA repair protein RadC
MNSLAETPGRKSVSRETASQLLLLSLDASSQANTGRKYTGHRVQKTLAEIRKLHEELNAALYSHPTERPAIHSPADVYEILKYFIAHLDHEEMWVMLLDTRNRVMSLVQLYKGSVNCAQIRIGEVFRQALLDNAPSIIIAHNHPSGEPLPSPDDVAVTRAIVQAGKLLDIEVLEHLIIANNDYISLKDKGLGFI